MESTEISGRDEVISTLRLYLHIGDSNFFRDCSVVSFENKTTDGVAIMISDLSNGVALPATPTVAVKGLSYLFPGGVPGLQDVALDLPAGSRTLLIGGEYLCCRTLYRRHC